MIILLINKNKMFNKNYIPDNLKNYSSCTYTFCSKINGRCERPESILEKYCKLNRNIIFSEDYQVKLTTLKRSKTLLNLNNSKNSENEYDINDIIEFTDDSPSNTNNIFNIFKNK